METSAIWRAIRRPTSAGVAGLVFGVILGVVIVLLRGAAPALASESGEWVQDPDLRRQIQLALYLIPFAGIAFLWFIAVIRSQLGSREDRFFETVFLGSGLLFVAMIFTTAAALTAALVLVDAAVSVPAETASYAWTFAASLLGSFGARMAAVFMLSATTMGVRTATVPRWLAVLSYIAALLLLFAPPFPEWIQFLFPLWVVVLSIFILTGQHQESVRGEDGLLDG